MKKITLSVLLVLSAMLCQAQTVFINEIHYDNTGGDVGEFVEVAGPAGTDLSTYSIVLYNGNGGATYNTIALSGTIDDEGSGFGAVSELISGIQNGAPDGVALVDGATLIQFLSYEGSFMATNGPANGIMSEDIGSEPGSTPIGQSLQLTGTGNIYTDFTWGGPSADSPGTINTGQTFNGGGGPGSPPVITCPMDVVTPAAAGTCEAVTTFTMPIASDPDGDLDTVTQTAGLPSGSAFPVGVNTVTFTATDMAGNSASCSFTITVEDTQAPDVTCTDLTVELDASGNVTVFADEVATATDNCPNPVTFSFEGPGVTSSLTTSFASNNGSAGNMFDTMALNDITMQSFDINLEPFGGPHDVEVYYKLGTYVGFETTPGDWTLAGTATGLTSVGQDMPTPLNLNMGIVIPAGQTVAWYVTTVTTGGIDYINGGTAGDLWASDANLEIYEGAGRGLGVFTGGVFSPRNFSGNAVYESVGPPVASLDFSCAEVGANTVLVIATDASGNESTCTTTITVEDTIAPEVVCIGGTNGVPVFINEIHYDNVGGDADEAIEIAGPAGTDLSTYSLVLYNGNGGVEYNNVALSGSIDDEGNGYGAVNFPITGIQNGAPDGIVLAENGTVIQFLSYEGSFTATDGIANGMTSTDIGVAEIGTPIGESLQLGGTGSNSGDFAWNPSMASTPGDINTGQTFMAPTSSGVDVVLDANGMATVDISTLVTSVNEACGFTVSSGVATSADIMVNGSFEDGDFTGWTVVEFVDPFIAYGVVDIFNPGFTFADALATDGTLFAANGFDAAGPDESVLYQEVSIPADAAAATLSWDENIDYDLQSFCTGCLDRIYEVQVRDLSDNVLEVLQTVTAEGSTTDIDNVWLSFTADLSAYAGQDVRIAFWQNVPETFTGPAKYSLDNVQLNVDTVVQMTTIELDCSNIGENQIEVTVTDDSGNAATCTTTVNVFDQTAPVLVCQDATIELGPDGTAEVDPMALLATMPDTVGEAVVIGSDNQSNAEGFTSFVVDITDAATIEFDWDYTTNDAAGFDGFGYVLNGTFTELTDPAVGNQSGSASVAVVPGDVFGYVSQTDDNTFGNNETVITNFMPGYTGQFDPANWTLTLDNSDGDAFFVIIPGGPLSFDACGITVLAVDITEVTCADIGTPITVTVFASDASGNLASCTSVVTVVDLLAPEVVCPADQTVDPGPGNLFYEIPDYYATGDATATDNCTDPLTILSQDPAAGTLVPDGTYTITMSATDEYGNVGMCTFELEVISVLGVSDNVLDSAITMFPNPASTTVTLANTSNVLLDQAAIYDTNGRLVSTIDLSDMQQEKVIDVSTLATGVYMVQVISENASTVKRLVKE